MVLFLCFTDPPSLRIIPRHQTSSQYWCCRKVHKCRDEFRGPSKTRNQRKCAGEIYWAHKTFDIVAYGNRGSSHIGVLCDLPIHESILPRQGHLMQKFHKSKNLQRSDQIVFGRIFDLVFLSTWIIEVAIDDGGACGRGSQYTHSYLVGDGIPRTCGYCHIDVENAPFQRCTAWFREKSGIDGNVLHRLANGRSSLSSIS